MLFILKSVSKRKLVLALLSAAAPALPSCMPLLYQNQLHEVEGASWQVFLVVYYLQVRGMEKTVQHLVKELANISIPIRTDQDMMSVASVAAGEQQGQDA